ncbi:hypothetical protein FBZ83_13113 [Azospirillum brasilense]|uniref:Uncharacterized protein n=1 Tax=Azospirillum brasilense TaxID=192 RepID=A0A560BLY9_AZOBR|nr:hypothetical protein FBZ83_13113 [Azospirillum brasilense]
MSGVLSLDAPSLTLPLYEVEGTAAASQKAPSPAKRGRVGMGAKTRLECRRGIKKQGKNHAA